MENGISLTNPQQLHFKVYITLFGSHFLGLLKDVLASWCVYRPYCRLNHTSHLHKPQCMKSVLKILI